MMVIPVYNDNGTWKRWNGTTNVDPNRVASLVTSGVWTSADYGRYGISMATEFVVPDGYRKVGNESFVLDGDEILQDFEIEEIPVVIPDTISRRQFKLQLEIMNLTTTVESWIDQQSVLIQIAYKESGSFNRTEPMMQTGFASLGFTEQQIDDFFLAASEL